MNKCFFSGRLGKDAEVRYTQSGACVVNFSLACNERYKDKKTGEFKDATEWITCVAWNKDKLVPYLVKGCSLIVEGKWQTKKWQAKDGTTRYQTECLVNNIELTGSKNASNGQGQQYQQPQANKPQPQPQATGFPTSQGQMDDPPF
ncbi:MAG: single-stranded DNA-binding protein [Prevotella sp.]|nr:single-stranded DNA-binding protein [Massilibacteroides sp.]